MNRLFLCAVGFGAFIPGVASAVVLYDTTGMTDTQTYNSTTTSNQGQSYISGLGNPGSPTSNNMWDQQACDDFTLATSADLTSVTADFLCPSTVTMHMPATGVLVEFFPTSGTLADNTPVAQAFLFGSDISGTTFSHTLSGLSYSTTGLRITVDLTSAGITLGPGTWWMSVQPVDETATGIAYYNVSGLGTTGFKPNRRKGSTWHGNTYGGSFTNTWAAFTGSAQRDLSFKVEGTPVPTPGAAATLGLVGLAAIRRRR